MRLHPFADGLPEIFDVGRSSSAEIDQKIAVQLGHLSSTNREPAATGIVNEFPGTVTRRILESRTARAVARLACFTLFLDRRHFGGDFFRLAGLPLQNRRGGDHIIGHPSVTLRAYRLCDRGLAHGTLT